MAKKEGKGFDLAAALADVSSLDTAAGTGPDKIVYVPLDKLHADPNNFYTLDGIEELAGNIELVGLQQPPRVRPAPDHPGEYILISGHRRRAACQLLADEGKEQFKTMPVIPEAAAGSDALQELKLILANSSTRKMTSAETAKQAERIQDLVYQLKEQYGEEYFPGRMRDYVAEACQISASRLARLKVIREGLIPEYREMWEAGTLQETPAYEFAHMKPETQRRVLKAMKTNIPGSSYIGELRKGIEEKGHTYEPALTCPGTETKCGHGDAFLRHDAVGYMYRHCAGETCCMLCKEGGRRDLDGYSRDCPQMCSKAKELMKRRREQKNADEEKAKRREQTKKEKVLQAESIRIMRAADSFGLSEQTVVKLCGYGWYGIKLALVRAWSKGDFSDRGPLASYIESLIPDHTKPLIALSKQLGCSTDYLLELTDDPKPWYSSEVADQ